MITKFTEKKHLFKVLNMFILLRIDLKIKKRLITFISVIRNCHKIPFFKIIFYLILRCDIKKSAFFN